MLIVAVLSLLVAVVIGYSLVRTRSRLLLTERRLGEARTSLEDVEADRAQIAQDNDRLVRERDDALERTRRASRDAVEVANRLNESNEARTDLQSEVAALAEQLAARTAESEELSSALAEIRHRLAEGTTASGMPSGLDVELLWGLVLADVDRTWRVSVAAGTEAASPLVGSRSLLRTALEIEVAASREQSGVLIDFDYAGDAGVDAAASVMTVAVVRELIAAATNADHTRVSVKVADAVEIVVVAQDEKGTTVPVRGPIDLEVRPGMFRVPRAPVRD